MQLRALTVTVCKERPEESVNMDLNVHGKHKYIAQQLNTLSRRGECDSVRARMRVFSSLHSSSISYLVEARTRLLAHYRHQLSASGVVISGRLLNTLDHPKEKKEENENH